MPATRTTERRWQRLTAALAQADRAGGHRLDSQQILDLLWMATLLAADIRNQPTPPQPPASPPAPESAGDSPSTPAAPDSTSPPPPDGSPPARQPLAPTQDPPDDDPKIPLDPAIGNQTQAGGWPRLSVAEPGLLPHPRRLGRALAPLNRQVETGSACHLDVPATVEAIARARAERGPWQPVLLPRRQGWLALHLVFDGHTSMVVWERLRRELPRCLSQQVQWRDLRCWTLSRNRGGTMELRGVNGRPGAPGQLRRPGGRDLVLVVSDLLAPSWRDGAMAAVLHDWAEVQPVLLLQVLPPRLWRRTGLTAAEGGWVQARQPLQHHARLQWQPLEERSFWPDDATASPPPGTVTLPLATLDPRDLAAMAGLLTAAGGNSLRGFRFELPAVTPAPAPHAPPTPPPSQTSPVPPSDQQIEERLAVFLFTASLDARRLLASLTYAGVITLPVVRLVLNLLGGAGGPAVIAEVLFSGLFRNVETATTTKVPIDQQQLCFVDEMPREHLREGLRERLREGLRVGQAREVYLAVEQYVAQSLGLSVQGFEALLRDPIAAPLPGEQLSDQGRDILRAFAMVSIRCLRGLGPDFEQRADLYETAWATAKAEEFPEKGKMGGLDLGPELTDPSSGSVSVETASVEPIVHLHIYGPIGIGKTRLALELCRQAAWADFVIYVPRSQTVDLLSLLHGFAEGFSSTSASSSSLTNASGVSNSNSSGDSFSYSSAQSNASEKTGSALRVSVELISRLKDQELGQLMSQLLRAQSYLCGAPVSEVRIESDELLRDDGEDAWTGKPKTPDEWLGDVETCWQLKAGKAGTPAQVKGEISKPLAQSTLRKDGRFVLVASGSTSGKKGENDRLKTLTTEAKAAGLPTDRIAVIGSERLVDWCNQHPAIAARWANRPGGFWPFQDLPAQEHQAPWQVLDSLTKELDVLRRALDPVHPNNDANPGVRVVVLADDTPADMLKPLRDSLERSEGRIRLITLGTRHSPDPRRITELAVVPLSNDSLSELVRWWYPAMPAELVRTAVDLAAGNPRLARLAADALAQNPGLSTTTLIEQPAIRELRAAIASHQKPKGRSDWTWPKAWDFTTYRSEKQQGFVGRQWLFEEVRAWATNPDSEQALLIGADYGVGKSAFLAELLDTGAAGLPVVAHHFCRADISDTLEAGRFVRSLAGQLADALPAYRALLEADDAKELRDKLDHADQKPLPAFDQAVLAPLRRIEAPATQVLLVIDALDEALDYRPEAGGSSRYTILDLLAKEARNLPPWLRVLATSRRRDEVLKPLRQGFFSIEEINAEDAENLADIHSYVKARCQQEPLAAILNRAGLSASETADLLQAKSGGKFLYAVRMLNDLASGALTLENRQSLDALSLGMDGFYADTFQRRFPEAGDYDVVKPLLALLCAQREPMGYGQLAAILEVSIDQIGRWIEPLQDLLRFQATPPSERSSDNAEEWRISFEHSSLQKWLTERSGGASRRPRAVRFGVDREVAAEQIRTWALAELEAGRAHTSPYLVRHLGNHLRDDERGEVIAGQLRQFPWLLARLREAGIEQLIEDFAIATFSPELVLLERLLKELSQVLRPEDGDAEDATLEQLAIQLSAQLPEEGSLGILRAQAEEWLASRRAVPEESRDDSISGGDNLQPTFQAGSPVNAMVCLPDGRLVSSDIASIRLWDVASGTSSAVLDGHEGWVRALVVLNNGQLVSGSDDRTIRLWDLASGSCSAVLEGHHGGVRDLAVLGDWCVASCSDDNTIRIWDLVSGTCSAVLEGHQSAVYALAVLVDGRIASGSDDRSIRLWDPVSGTCIAVIQGHQGGVRALAVLADGRLASGSEDRTIRLWDMETGTCSSRLEGHQGRVRALMVLADNRLASGSDDATIRIWDTSSGACSAVFEGHEREVNALAVLGDGRLTSGSDDRTIRLWDPTSSTVNGDSEEGSSGSPSLQRPGFVSTWPEEIELQPISFTTSTLTRERKTGFRAIGRPYGGWMRQDRQGEAWAFLDPNGPRGLTMVRIPAGSFRMGSPIDEAERHESEGPVHEVTLQEFLMSQTPITQGQWREVAEWQEKEGERWGRDLKPNPSWFCDAFDSEQRPVELVCWHDAREFCNRLSRRTKRIYTLPSEAQWEYSCRASKITTFAFGDTITPELANYAGGDSYANGPQGEHRKQTTPVGLFPANAWGLQDMHGNVREWCLDDWHRSYEGAPEDENAWLAESEGYINKGAVERKLLRGGSWHVSSMYCRSAYRSHDNPVNAHFDVGFRVVCLPQGRLS